MEHAPDKLQGHSPHNVSAGWGDKTVYAIFTSKGSAYRSKLEAQLETWAKRPAQQHRYVAVGGQGYPAEWLEEGVVLPSSCQDDLPHISCKEAYLIAEGAARQPQWLVIVGEDQYVDTEKMDKALGALDADVPQAFGCVGCGKDGMAFCPTVRRSGGFCGGCGYAISRAALNSLMDKGTGSLNAYYQAVLWPNDVTTSCALRERQIPLRDIDGVTGFPIFTKRDLLGMMDRRQLTYHYLVPEVMRFMHAILTGEKDEAKLRALDKDAFDRGCLVGMTRWAVDYQRCLDQNFDNWKSAFESK